MWASETIFINQQLTLREVKGFSKGKKRKLCTILSPL